MDLLVQKNLNGQRTRFQEMIIAWQLSERLITGKEIADYDSKFQPFGISCGDMNIIMQQRPKLHTARPLAPNLISHTALIPSRWFWMKINEADPVHVFLEHHSEPHLILYTVDGEKYNFNYTEIKFNKITFYVSRYYPGIELQPCMWTRKPYYSVRFPFANNLLIKRVDFISIKWEKSELFVDDHITIPVIKINNKRLTLAENVVFLFNDGFQDNEHMRQFFKEDFSGQLITWGDINYNQKIQIK